LAIGNAPRTAGVPSKIIPPGLSFPCATASSTIPGDARSLTEPPGLRNSALSGMRHPVSAERLCISMNRVLPTLPQNHCEMLMNKTFSSLNQSKPVSSKLRSSLNFSKHNDISLTTVLRDVGLVEDFDIRFFVS
jgi:hypothetical protein